MLPSGGHCSDLSFDQSCEEVGQGDKAACGVQVSTVGESGSSASLHPAGKTHPRNLRAPASSRLQCEALNLEIVVLFSRNPWEKHKEKPVFHTVRKKKKRNETLQESNTETVAGWEHITFSLGPHFPCGLSSGSLGRSESCSYGWSHIVGEST